MITQWKGIVKVKLLAIPLTRDGAFSPLARERSNERKTEEFLVSLSSGEDNWGKRDASQDSALLTSLFQVFSTFC